MKQSSSSSIGGRIMEILYYLLFSVSILLSFSASSSVEAAASAYKNYTVGDSLGWYDNLMKPTVNYQKWLVGKTFSLGDFLVFNTDTNHSVVQTYNFTTYKRCDYNNAETDDTTQWSVAEPSATTPSPITVAVPLVKEGMTYFFSGDYDGEQCKHGQRFRVNVTHGLGLPESLKNPSAQAPSPSNLDDDSTPNQDTTVSSNFNHPKETGEDDSDDAKSTAGYMKMPMKLSWVLGVLGVVCLSF